MTSHVKVFLAGVSEGYVMRSEPHKRPRVDKTGRAAPAREAGNGIDRKSAEEKLALSERHARDLIETIPAMAWSTLADGSNVFVSKRWTEYTA